MSSSRSLVQIARSLAESKFLECYCTLALRGEGRLGDDPTDSRSALYSIVRVPLALGYFVPGPDSFIAPALSVVYDGRLVCDAFQTGIQEAPIVIGDWNIERFNGGVWEQYIAHCVALLSSTHFLSVSSRNFFSLARASAVLTDRFSLSSS